MKNYVNGINIPSARIFGEYNCGAYGAGTYDGACTSNSNGSLADTGYNILLPIALGVALIIAAAILIIKRIRRRSNKSSK